MSIEWEYGVAHMAEGEVVNVSVEGTLNRASRTLAECNEDSLGGGNTCYLVRRPVNAEWEPVPFEPSDSLPENSKRWKAPWRVGRKVGRTIYDSNDVLIGVMDTPELAAWVVYAVNFAAPRTYITEDAGNETATHYTSKERVRDY